MSGHSCPASKKGAFPGHVLLPTWEQHRGLRNGGNLLKGMDQLRGVLQHGLPLRMLRAQRLHTQMGVGGGVEQGAVTWDGELRLCTGAHVRMGMHHHTS